MSTRRIHPQFSILWRSPALLALAALLLCVQSGFAQPGLGQQGIGIGQQNPIGQPGNQLGQGNQGNVFGGIGGNGFGSGFGGGSANADFDSLIDLITATVENDSWMENGTGDGEIQPFPTGVYVSAAGALSFQKLSAENIPLARAEKPSLQQRTSPAQDSPMRFVSLPRLEAAIWRRQLAHQPLSLEMLTLAGLQRVEFLLVDPNSGDLILAGPAGDWQVQADGRIVSTATGHPVVRLDNLLTLWRRRQTQKAESFGCSIIPRQQALAATQGYIQRTGQQPLEPGGRGKWLAGLRDTLGKQDVEFFGITADNHVARVLLLADYHMKLIGMGIAEGVPGVRSYLSTVKLLPDGTAPPMAVLRWWFAMNYEAVQVSADRSTYRLVGPGVKVLSENELLAAQGRRVHTGQSDELNLRFANSFTKHFDDLSDQYPIYGELRNIFDLELALSIVQREGIRDRIGWEAALFSAHDSLKLPNLAVPAEVETVINHRVINRKHIIAGISGGVWLDAAKAAPLVTAAEDELARPNLPRAPQQMADQEIVWWWD